MENIVENVVSNTVNEIELLTSIDSNLSNISVFLIFFIVVILCYFVYKFFNERRIGCMLKTIVTAEMLNGVLDEITGLLPIVIPVMIGFIAIRKGISFLQGILHAA